MAARGLDIPEHIRVRVAECADTARLEAWADRAATATSVDEIFRDSRLRPAFPARYDRAGASR
jgi:hypothetical protein